MLKKQIVFLFCFLPLTFFFSEECQAEVLEKNQNLEALEDFNESNDSNTIFITIPSQEYREPEVVYPIAESDFAEVYRKIP